MADEEDFEQGDQELSDGAMEDAIAMNERLKAMLDPVASPL